MTAVILGLGSGVFWGSADFFGGLASRRADPNITTMLVQGVGVAALAVAVFLGGFAPPSPDVAVLAIAAGIVVGRKLGASAQAALTTRGRPSRGP